MIKRILVLILTVFIPLSGISCSKAEAIEGKIAFYSLRDEKDGWSSYLLKDGNLTLLGKKKAAPTFSPNGKKIALATHDDGIHVVDETGTVLEKIPVIIDTIKTKLGPGHLKWSNDASFILYTMWSKDLKQQYLVLYSFEREESAVIVDLGSGTTITSVGVSHDSKRIILAVSDDHGDTRKGLYICNSDGSGLKRLQKQGFSEMWFPDNKHIAYYTNRDEEGNPINDKWGVIFKMNVDTMMVQKIRDLDYPILQSPIRLTRDGKYFYFPRPLQQGGLHIVAWPVDDSSQEIDLTKPVKLSGGQGYSQDRLPDWYIE